MITFFLRRFLTSALVVLVSTFVMYVMVDLAIDPLEKFRASNAPNKQQQMERLTEQLRLDEPVTVRYLDWLQGVSGCAYGQCDLGRDWELNQTVSHQVGDAIITTLQLITAATLIAVLLGIVIGVVSALRQYTGFDYAITFVSFLLYSLPVFVMAVLLKEKLAITFNDFLEEPHIAWGFVLGAALVVGLASEAILGGGPLRRLRNFTLGAVVVVAFAWVLNVRDFFRYPSRGDGVSMLLVALLAILCALAVTELSTGVRNRRALGSSLTVAAIGIALYYPMLFFWAAVNETWLLIGGLGLVSVVVGLAVGWLWGGPDRGRNARTAALTAIPVAGLLFVDRLLQAWHPYLENGRINGRALATTGPETPNLTGSFWILTIDTFTHLLLPTITLVLVSLAQYTRYIRGSTLDVLNQDYIRTARSKGLTERTVVMRHALRNALLPLAAIIPVDVITVVGGAIITETVFGWYGMGRLFANSLHRNVMDPVMAYILIVAIFAVLANIVADICYAVLDPRIRVAA